LRREELDERPVQAEAVLGGLDEGLEGVAHGAAVYGGRKQVTKLSRDTYTIGDKHVATSVVECAGSISDVPAVLSKSHVV
jgi:hypothetical protein